MTIMLRGKTKVRRVGIDIPEYLDKELVKVRKELNISKTKLICQLIAEGLKSYNKGNINETN